MTDSNIDEDERKRLLSALNATGEELYAFKLFNAERSINDFTLAEHLARRRAEHEKALSKLNDFENWLSGQNEDNLE